jgi:hypothetical protein
MDCLLMDANRNGYSPDQCGTTLTVGELLNALLNAVVELELDRDMPIYVSNDNGYTYGSIYRDSFRIGEEWKEADEWWMDTTPYDDGD